MATLDQPESQEGAPDKAWLSRHRAIREIAPDPRPRLLLMFGTIITALAAGPTVLLVAVAQSFVTRDAAGFGATPSVADAFSALMGMAGGVLYLGTLYGLTAAIPAAIVNSLASGMLARRGWDSPWIGLACGVVVGLTIPDLLDVAPRLSSGETLQQAISQREYRGFWMCFGIAGGLMGLLNWWLVIRPLRKWRMNRHVD